MNDPTSSFYAPPPRYLLESDSSDEEGQGGYPGGSAGAKAGPSGSKRETASPKLASVVGLPGGAVYAEAVMAVGQSGRFLSRKAGNVGKQIARVVVGDDTVGKVIELGTDRVVLVALDDVDGEEAWSLAKALVISIDAKRWTLITAYVPAMYITQATSHANDRSDPPIRAISKSHSPEGSAKWDAPNHLTGIAAALHSMAAHPAFPKIPPESTSTLLLPLPLSSLSNSFLLPALKSQSSSLVTALQTAQSHGGKASRWTEADDESYTAPGMGKGRRARHWGADGGKDTRDDVGGMYM